MKKNLLSEFEWECIWAACRYFYGRESIAASMFPSRVITECYDRMTDMQKETLASDMKREMVYSSDSLSTKSVRVQWEKFIASLKVKEHFTATLTDGSKCTLFRIFFINSPEDKGFIYYSLEDYLKNPGMEVSVPYESIVSVDGRQWPPRDEYSFV
jgi:hypothetical protein